MRAPSFARSWRGKGRRMSEHDTPRGAEEQAYLDAEALLDDDAMRAKRRARVLDAITDVPSASAPTATAPRPERSFIRRGGWLAAAGVAGLSALIAVDYYNPADHRKPPETSTSVHRAPADASPSVARVRPDPALQPTPRLQPAAPARGEDRTASQETAAVEAAPSPQARYEPSPSPAPAPAAPVVPERYSELAVAQTREALVPGAAPGAAAGVRVAGAGAAAERRLDQAKRLRAAASQGRVSELTNLLAQGVNVDARGVGGETALMRAVRDRQVAAAELLVRHGADPDLEDDGGLSARDVAEALDDPGLTRALNTSR